MKVRASVGKNKINQEGDSSTVSEDSDEEMLEPSNL